MDENVTFVDDKPSALPLDPRTKIFLTITVSSILVAGGVGGVMNIIRPCLALMPFVFFIYDKRYKNAFQYLFSYILLFICELFLIPYTSGVMGFIMISFIAAFSHMLPGGIMGYYMISSTTVSEFVAAMEKIHLPQKIIIPISVIFRFFPTVKEEADCIKDAMRMRGIGTFRTPFQMLEYRVVPLLMSVVKIGEELSASALTRGLGGPNERTNICKIGFGLFDIVMTMIALACWAGFLFL